jgi:hypothetical protein
LPSWQFEEPFVQWVTKFDQATHGVWEFTHFGTFEFGIVCEIGDGAGLIRQVGNFENPLVGRV